MQMTKEGPPVTQETQRSANNEKPWAFSQLTKEQVDMWPKEWKDALTQIRKIGETIVAQSQVDGDTTDKK